MEISSSKIFGSSHLSSYWSVSIFSGAEDLYVDQYGIFRPTLRVPASKNIEGYDFYLGRPMPPGFLPSHLQRVKQNVSQTSKDLEFRISVLKFDL